MQLAVSQPAISKAVADLEYTLGVRLLDRIAQGVEPTMYGRSLLKWGAAVFDDLRQGVQEIEFLADPTAGEVRIGSTEPMTAAAACHRPLPRGALRFDGASERQASRYKACAGRFADPRGTGRDRP